MFTKLFRLCCILFCLSKSIIETRTTYGSYLLPQENDSYWNRIAFKSLMKGVRIYGSPRKAVKNVILIVGDGMGMSTITAARILKGQLVNKTGEESELSWEKFPHLALAKTYNTDHQVPDSSGTATAMLSGVKTKMSVVGVNDSIEYQKCDTLPSASIPNIADWFHESGKSVGLITNSRITHATPSCLFAHAVDRNLESDTDFDYYNVSRGRWPEFCKDIAKQLVQNEPGNKLKVVLGGGWSKFLKSNENFENLYALSTKSEDLELNLRSNILSNKTPKHNILNRSKRLVFGYSKPQIDREVYNCKKGNRSDENLIRAWIKDRESAKDKYEFVVSREQLNRVDANTDYLLGLFAHDHMSYESMRRNVDNHSYGIEEPSLTEMTSKALDILTKNSAGFFLLIEASRIDHAHHQGKAKLALEETLVMDNAVNHIMDRIKNQTLSEDTLVIVTADHSHVFNLGGYPLRGNPILGLDREYKEKEYELSDVDGMPYTSITYGNGPGGINPENQSSRQNLTKAQLEHADYQAQAAVPLTEETHGGEDVPIYAIGPNSHIIYGVQEQHYIGHVMAFASCTGPYKSAKHCHYI